MHCACDVIFRTHWEVLDIKLLCMMQPRRKKVHCLGLHDSVRKYKWEITGAEILLQSYLSLLLLSESFCAYGLLQQIEKLLLTLYTEDYEGGNSHYIPKQKK